MSNRSLVIAALVATFAVGAVPRPGHALQLFGSQTSNQLGTQNEFAQVGLDYGAIVTYRNPNTGNLLFNPDGSYFTLNMAWPIAPNWALRANHVSAPQPGTDLDIAFDGTLHRVVESVRIGGSDLRLVRVDTPFSRYAQMYDPTLGGTEIGQQVVMVGSSGLTKNVNAPYTTNNGTFMNGWSEASLPENENGKPNWGLNRVEEVFPNVLGSEVLYTTFDQATINGSPNPRSYGDNEAAAISGDSGGGLFIKQNNEWRLAGVMYAVDEVFRTADVVNDRASITGAVYDARNFWAEYLVDENDPNGPRYRELIVSDNPVPLGTYSTRVSTYRSQINAVIVPEAGTASLALLGAGGLAFSALVRRRRAA